MFKTLALRNFTRSAARDCGCNVGRNSARNASRNPLRTSVRSYSAQPQAKSASTPIFAGAAAIAGAVAGAALYKFSDSSAVQSESTPAQKELGELTKVQYADKETIKKALDEIAESIGKDKVVTNHDDCVEASDSDWQSRHHHPWEVASAIARPSSTQDVSNILKICNKYKVPVVALSGGTSLEGHITPVYGGVTLDMSGMAEILELHKEDLDVVVQPAIDWESLGDYLAPYGLMFGTDAGPGANIGGMCANCSSGIGAFRNGPMRHNVVNLTVVLADGTVFKTKRRPRKSSAGYSLNDLFVGSEGTLGIVTEVTLKLTPAPQLSRVGILTYNKIQDATETVQDLLLIPGLQLNAVEFMDDNQMRIINEAGLTDSKFAEKHSLLLRFAGSSENTINSDIEKVREAAKKHELVDMAFSNNKDESDELWSARKNALWSMMNWATPKKMWTTDVAVPISNLSTIMQESRDWLKDVGLDASIVGHVGDGNFHALIAYDPKTELEQTEHVVDKMVKRAIELDGTSTGEHGIGVGKRHYLVEEVGPDAVAVMRGIKQTLDPNMILNPGKVFQTSLDDVTDH